MTKYMVCKCGWVSKPYPDDSMFVGLGGELPCPECTKLKRNKGIEAYGSIEVITMSESYNPSKRENIKSLSTLFFCSIIGKHADEGTCRKCPFRKSFKPECLWKIARRKQHKEEKGNANFCS